MEAANGPACHGGSHARPPGSLRGRGTTRALLERIDRVHEDVSTFSGEPRPPWETLPTIACPPSFTVTCSTRTVCSPPLRYRLSASACAAKGRASLLNARSALSCCGILSTWARPIQEIDVLCPNCLL